MQNIAQSSGLNLLNRSLYCEELSTTTAASRGCPIFPSKRDFSRALLTALLHKRIFSHSCSSSRSVNESLVVGQSERNILSGRSPSIFLSSCHVSSVVKLSTGARRRDNTWMISHIAV